MPTLNPPPLEAAVPGAVRRRVWRHPELRSHSLLVLTLDHLHAAPLAGDPKPEVVAAVEAGADLDDLLGPLAAAVDLAAVRNVKLDLLTNSLTVDYAGPTGTRRLAVVFATPEAADACFTKVWRRLGGDFGLRQDKRDSWALARAPLMVLAVVLLVTAALGMVGALAEDGAAHPAAVSGPAAGELGTPAAVPRGPFQTLLGWLNWRVVCGAGGAAAAVAQVWLYRRLTQPPASLELVRT